METARRVYRSYGFFPIDTPSLEYYEILAGKGGEESDKQLYQFRDHGDRHVGMRFDLTVPLARFAAQHVGELGTPLKRYHIATVWRGERKQRGRYREFMQCDFDTIGTRSVAADIETALVVNDLFEAIGFERFTIRVNNRRVLAGVLEKLDLAEQCTPILRALDKLAKIGPEAVAREMAATAGVAAAQAEEVLRLAKTAGTNDEILREVESLTAGSEKGERGTAELAQLLGAVRAANVPEGRIKLDVSIARGLDYYTGTIYETFLEDMPDIGSVCSGGRYDNLAELYTDQELPGVGASLGLDRLLAAMEELGMIEATSTPAAVFIPYFDESRLNDYVALASRLRKAGIATEVFPDAKKLGQQLKYADRRGFRIALIAGTDEFAAGVIQVKSLVSGEKKDVSAAEVVDTVSAMLGDGSSS